MQQLDPGGHPGSGARAGTPVAWCSSRSLRARRLYGSCPGEDPRAGAAQGPAASHAGQQVRVSFVLGEDHRATRELYQPGHDPGYHVVGPGRRHSVRALTRGRSRCRQIRGSVHGPGRWSSATIRAASRFRPAGWIGCPSWRQAPGLLVAVDPDLDRVRKVRAGLDECRPEPSPPSRSLGQGGGHAGVCRLLGSAGSQQAEPFAGYIFPGVDIKARNPVEPFDLRYGLN